MHFLGNTLDFPSVLEANEDGIVAIGLRMDTPILKVAYSKGMFPWYNEDEPVLWWCPAERMVIEVPTFNFSKRMEKLYQQHQFTITRNTCFADVIRNCQQVNRKGQEGTWINEEIIAAFTQLHHEGLAQSVEIWQNDVLVGGLYGVDLDKRIFCGESMFSKVTNASKIAFVYLVKYLQKNNYILLDCQMYNDYLAQLGAYTIPRNEYLKYIREI